MRKTVSALLGSGALFALAMLPQIAAAAQASITIADDYYSPQSVTINPGDTVVWNDQGVQTHTVTADNGSFDSGQINQGQNFAYTFATPGTYGFHDRYYGAANGVGMAGTVIVAAAQTTSTANSNSSGVSVSSPSTSSSQTSASALAAQAQALLQQIAALKAQLGISSNAGTAGSTGVAATTNSGTCPVITRSLALGSSGADVLSLQQFLAEDPSVYPSGLATGYFGTMTQQAVEAWQTKYGIVSSGSPATTGWGVVGPRTIAAIEQQCSQASTSTTQAPASMTFGGYISVTPSSGASPLTVTVTTNVNTTNSCTGATYLLNFGDGSTIQQIVAPPNVCGPITTTFTHTYTYGGTYQMTLTAGNHQSSATITVSGPSQAQAANIPADSIRASITSGPAPLSVTFVGTVASESNLGCSGTCNETVNFGDGSVGLVALPTTNGTWQSYTLTHTYTAPGTYAVQLLSVTGQSIGSSISISVNSSTTSY